ncbi:MAG: ATP-binding protein [Pseudonocardiaceae bacterium]
MKLIAREQDFSTLQKMYVDSLDGRGSVAVVSGAVGSGKTELLRAIEEWATESGSLVLAANCSPVERALPLSLVTQLFHSVELDPEHAEKVSLFLNDRAGAHVLTEPDREVINRIDTGLTKALSTLLLELAKNSPLVIVIDDLHHADGLSLQLLIYFVNRLKTARVLVVVTVLASCRPAYPMLSTELLRPPYTRCFRLAPLSHDEVGRILSQGIDDDAAQLAATCHAISGGNLRLICALMDDFRSLVETIPARRAQHVFLDVFLGDAFSEAVRTSLQRFDTQVLRIAQAVAVLGDLVSPTLLGKILDMAAESTTQAIQELDIAGLLDSGQFRHQAVRSIILADMVSEERADLHLRIAELLHDGGAPATTVAGHLIAARRTQGQWALEVLLKAAEQVADDGQIGMAFECLNLAYQDCSDEREWVPIATALVKVAWRLNPFTALRHLPQLTEAIREGHLDGRGATMIIRYLLWHGKLHQAEQAVNSLYAAARTAGAKEAATELNEFSLWLSCSYPEFSQRISAVSGGETKRSISLSPETIYPSLQGTTLLADLLTGGSRENAVLNAEQFLRSCRPHEAVDEPLTSALAVLVYAGELDSASTWCVSILNKAASRRDVTGQALISSLQAEIAVRSGDPPSAEQFSQRALKYISTQSWGLGIGAPLASILLAATVMGKYQEAAEYLNQPVPKEMFQSRFGLYYQHARGHYYLATNNGRAALADFRVCGELMQRWGIDQPSLVPWRTDMAQALLHLGEKDRARKLVLEQLARIGAERSRAYGISLRVLAATTDLQHQLQLLKESIDVLGECGDRLELARSLADLSSVYHILGESAKARMTIRRARHVAGDREIEHMQARYTKKRTSKNFARFLGAQQGTVGQVTELTVSERRVAVLVAQGFTNREVAQKLYISVSTVEQHLSRTYRKLKINRRAELPARLGPNDMHDMF